MRITGGEGRGGGFRRFVITILIIALIVWVTLFLIARTEGGQQFVVNQLTECLDLEVTVKQVKLAFPLTLVMDGVRSENFVPRKAGMQVKQARLSLGVKPWWRMSLEEPELNMAYSKAEEWSPDVFAALGELPGKNMNGIAELTGNIRKMGTLQITHGNLTWVDASGRKLAEARNLDFNMGPACVPGHLMTYYHLSVEHVINPGGGTLRKIECEWLSSAEVPYVEISRSENIPTGKGPGFWGAQE